MSVFCWLSIHTFGVKITRVTLVLRHVHRPMHGGATAAFRSGRIVTTLIGRSNEILESMGEVPAG